ncbi:MAG: flagellar basal body P-ring formation protein FlgA [Chromatiales bacterium]|jgi:flagella basal body P-ring formation protein FlgA|nr:flagellar basal body P-ring formation protein FlgA [Chromatiales bacterium]
MTRASAGALITLLLWPWLALADFEPHQRILDTAQRFLQKQAQTSPGKAEIRLGTIDQRLRLARCDGALEAWMPPNSRLTGNTSVGVRCTGTQPWKLFVPAHITRTERVLVSHGYLPRGTVLTREHLTLAEREVGNSTQGYMKDYDQAIGQVLRQALQDGLLLTPNMLQRPKLIQRGEEVFILSHGGAFEVRMKGSALSDGAEGERIRVKNLNSSRIVEGTVSADGNVVIQM